MQGARNLRRLVGFLLAGISQAMPQLRHLLVIAALALLAPALLVLLYAPRSAAAQKAAAAEDALLLRLGDALSDRLTAEGNADALAARMRSELGACGVLKIDGAAVTVSATGCKLSDGRALSGPLTVQVHRGPRGFTVALSAGASVPVHTAAAGQDGAGALAARQ
jgi:hypothetical protein